jgi:hypothetical protein
MKPVEKDVMTGGGEEGGGKYGKSLARGVSTERISFTEHSASSIRYQLSLLITVLETTRYETGRHASEM